MKGSLTVKAQGEREMLITRAFDAPAALVWRAVTEPELIRRWMFTPPGWTLDKCEEDVRPGGRYRWTFRDASGAEAMALSGEYREVVRPSRIVRTEQFEFGCVPQAGEQLCTMTLAEVAKSTTSLQIHILFPSREARDGMLASGMEQGMGAGYDAMEELLIAGIGA